MFNSETIQVESKAPKSRLFFEANLEKILKESCKMYGELTETINGMIKVTSRPSRHDLHS